MEATLLQNKTIRGVQSSRSSDKLKTALQNKFDFNFDTNERITSNLFGIRYDNEYVVYSYGRHFRIATYSFKTNKWTINGESYSVSTSRHQSTVFCALSEGNLGVITTKDIQKAWRTRTYANRAKWARDLTATQWADLQECQDTANPLLRDLKADIKLQDEAKIICGGCLSAWNTINTKKG